MIKEDYHAIMPYLGQSGLLLSYRTVPARSYILKGYVWASPYRVVPAGPNKTGPTRFATSRLYQKWI